MALVSCPECQKEVSIHALACPQCAFPFPGKQASAVGGQLGNKLYACPDCGCAVSKKAKTCPHCGVILIGDKRSLPTNKNSVEETWLCTHCGTPYTRKVRQEKELVTDQEAWPTSNAGRSVERLLEPGPHQETGPTNNAGGSVEKLLEPGPHQETGPTSNAGRSVERRLEPVSQPEAGPANNAGGSVERRLEPVSQPEAGPTSNAGGSVERRLEPVPQPEAGPTSNGGRSMGRSLGPVPHQVKREDLLASPRRRSQLWQDSSHSTKMDQDVVSPRYPRSRKRSILLGLLVFILIAISVVTGAVWQLQGINPLEVLVYWRM